jgi:hypothetical protein
VCFVHFTNEQSEGGDHIVFQQDHQVPRPTSQWRKGETLADGPYEIEVPAEAFDTYDIVIGLFKGSRVSLKGTDAGGDRVLIGRLQVQREGDRITNITLADVGQLPESAAAPRADFTAHLNPTGTRVDFGKIATDGSVKVNIGKQSLTVFPYPRDREFTVALDLKAIVPNARIDPAKAQVKALAAGTQADMGKVASSVEGGRLTFRVGMKGAGRYAISW